MKMTFFLSLLVACLSIQAQQPLNVMTFNIRYNTPNDSANAWPLRKDKVASQILFHEADIIGVQEALHGQIMDLKERLPRFAWVGRGRDNGRQAGEYSAIFFDTTRVQLIKTETFWLSPEPEKPGVKGWDAAFPRVVTWASFRDRRTKKQFTVFNTHFDHMGKVARAESARLLLQKVKEIAGSQPVIVTGDFNATPEQEPIQVILNEADPLHLTDSKAVSANPHYGPEGTFNGFQSKENSNQPIDYIFIKNGPKVQQHATLSQTWGGRFSSDHFPVFARVII
jgi:endonuclease/exonuclease/phosphatase family metal-dependent hydrolase